MTKPQHDNRLQKRFRRFWEAVVEPASSLKDPLERQRARLLNSLMLIFLPLAIIVLIVQIVLIPIQDFGQSTAIKAVIMGIALVALIYLFSRAGYYRFTTYFLISVGLIAIITNAVAANPPYVEIAYLIMLPLVGTLLLSFRETLMLAAVTIISLIIFDIALRDQIPVDIIKDMLIFTMFTDGFYSVCQPTSRPARI